MSKLSRCLTDSFLSPIRVSDWLFNILLQKYDTSSKKKKIIIIIIIVQTQIVSLARALSLCFLKEV